MAGSLTPVITGLQNGFTNIGVLARPGLVEPDAPSNAGLNSNPLINLSNTARELLDGNHEAFRSADSELRQLQKAERELAEQRLTALKERINFIRNFLAYAGPEQKRLLLRNIQSLGRELSNIGSQIEDIANRPGLFSGAQENLNVELNITRFVEREESIEITQTQNGIEIEKTIRQTEIVVTELNIEQNRTLIAGNLGNNNFALNQQGASEKVEDLIQTFLTTARDIISLFKNVLDDLSEA